MAIYHCSVKIIGRSSGRSAVGSSAYRSGERLENERDGIVHDYTKKSGVVYSEIVVPEHAPAWTKNRQTLWNEVEKIEKSSKAQLAREFELALPAELGHEQQKKIVSKFANDLAKEGMIIDVAMHDKGDGNPHAHLMATLRRLDRDGAWKEKQRKEYILDQHGNKQYDPQKKTYKCKTVKTTDWDKTETLEKWRENWSKVVNKHLEIAGHEQRIDHRSYKEQGIEQIPTIHEGAIARKIDGRENQISDRCEINREIAKENQQLEQCHKQEKLCQQLKVMAEREPAPVVQQPDPPRQLQEEEVRQVVEEQQQPAPKQEVPVVESAEITLGSLLEEVKEYNAILMARDMERADRITDITKEIAEISKPYRAEAIEMHINEKWGMKWKMMQEEKTSLTKEIRKYNMGEGYSFWDKHIGGKYEKDGDLLRMKSKNFDEREKELISTMNRARNELSAGGGRDIGEVNRLADRLASEREPRCLDKIQELQKEKNSIELARRESVSERSEIATLRDNLRKVKERSSGDRKLLIPLGQEKGQRISFAKSMESPKIREEMKLVSNKLNAAMQNEYRQLRDRKHSLSMDRDTGGGRSR